MPRFNNSGTQTTILLLQNPTNYQILGTIYFWDASGTSVGNSNINLGPKQLMVLATQTVAAGSGAITIAHNGCYGDLFGQDRRTGAGHRLQLRQPDDRPGPLRLGFPLSHSSPQGGAPHGAAASFRAERARRELTGSARLVA